MRSRAIATTAALTAAAALAAAAPAGATFPGHNGRLAFVALDKHKNAALFTQFPSRAGLRAVRADPGGNPAWSPDGKRLAFPDGLGIGVVRSDGSGYRHLSAPPHVDTDDVTWAPGGKRIAFTGFTGDSSGPEDEITDTAVYTGPVDGGGFKRVHAGSNPSWAPNGKRIAFIDDDRKCIGISTVTTAGTSLKRVTGRTAKQCRVFGIGGEDPDYSPDGRTIAYIRPTRRSGNASDRNYELFEVGATGKHDRQITHTAGADEDSPAFSPDGRLIAYGLFGTRRNNAGSFYARASDGRMRRQFRTDVYTVSWQPRR